MWYIHTYNELDAEPTDEGDFIETIPVDGDPYYWECIWCGEPCFGCEPWNTSHTHCTDKPDSQLMLEVDHE
jgi:hypothetical protein